MDKVEVLKKSDVFRELNDEQLRSVAELCSIEVFDAGSTIHHQNDVVGRLRVIEEGLVVIQLEVGPMSQRQVMTATNYETIGWSAIVPPYLATTTARAVEKTKLLTFIGHDLLRFCEANGQAGCLIYRGVARVVAERLHAAFMQCVNITSVDG